MTRNLLQCLTVGPRGQNLTSLAKVVTEVVTSLMATLSVLTLQLPMVAMGWSGRQGQW